MKPSELKECPACAEAVPASAKKCHHCGEALHRRRQASPLDGVYADVPDTGLAGVGGVLGALVGFVLGSPLEGLAHGALVVLAAAVGFAAIGALPGSSSDEGGKDGAAAT